MKRLAIFIFLLLPVWAWADSEGPNYPSAYQMCDNWVNPESSYAADSKFAVNSAVGHQDILSVDGFGFSISGAYTIDSFLVRITGYGSAKGEEYRDIRAGLCKDARTGAVTGDYPHFILPEGNDHISNVIVGTGFSASEINDTHFGVALWPDVPIEDAAFYIDCIRVTVYYHAINVTHSMAFYDSSTTTLSAYDNYTDGYDPDTLLFYLDDLDYPTEIDTIVDPTDPDSATFSGLAVNSLHYVWGVTIKDGVRDTSSSINRYTKHIKFTSHAVVETTFSSMRIKYILTDTTGTVDSVFLKFGTSKPPGYKDTIIAGNSVDTFCVDELLPETKYYYKLLAKDEGYTDTISTDSMTTESMPSSTPDSIMVTTWYSETFDSAGYGFVNPDPADSLEGIISYTPEFTIFAGEQDTIWEYYIQIHTGSGTGGDSFWYSGITALPDNDTIDSHEPTPKIAWVVSKDKRFKAGHEYFWRAQLYSGVTPTASGWTDWNHFTGVSPSHWWDTDYIYRNQFIMAASHATATQYTPVKLVLKTGETIKLTDKAPIDLQSDIKYNPNDNYTYMVWVEEEERYATATTGQYGYFIAKYNNSTEVVSEPVLVGAYKTQDAHYMPLLAITDSSLFVIIGGHNGKLTQPDYMMMFRCDSLIADSGFILTEFLGGGPDTATAEDAGPDSTVINVNADWATNELANYYVMIRPQTATEEEEKILANNNCTLFVASDWSVPPVSGDEYVIYSRVENTWGNTYPSPVTVGDSLYIFYRQNEYRESGDSTGTASGTHSVSTLQDNTKSWTPNCFKYWMIIDSVTDDTARVASNTATTITIEGEWTPPTNGDGYILHTGHKGFWCYVRFDPYAAIGSAYSDMQYVVNYNDGPYWHGQRGPSAYAWASHNDQNDNRYVHMIATLWDYYGTSAPADSQGGGAFVYARSQLDGGLFKTWENAAGDTIGYSFTDKFFHTDSTLNKGAWDDIIDTCAGAHDSLFISASNQRAMVVDTNNVPYVSWSKFRENNQAKCALYFARYYNDEWQIDSLTEGSTDSLINFRYGAYPMLDGNGLSLIGEIWDNYTGELKMWSTSVNLADLAWTEEMLTRSSSYGIGRLNVQNVTHTGCNNQVIYKRGELVYFMDLESFPYTQFDGDDIRVVINKVDTLGNITYVTSTADSSINRLPVRTFGVDSCLIEFVSPAMIMADSLVIEDTVSAWVDYLVEVYYKNRLAENPPVTKVNVTSGLWKLWDSFELLDGNSDLDDATYWSVGTGTATVYDYWDSWSMFDGLKAVGMSGYTRCKYSGNATFIVSYNTIVGAYLKISGAGKIIFELYDNDSRCYKIGLGSSSIYYDRHDGEGLVASDSMSYLDYAQCEFRIGVPVLPTGAYPIYGYVDDELIFSSTVADTFDTGRHTSASGYNDRVIDATKSYEVDALIGYFLKFKSGNFKDTVREITDNNATNVIFSALSGNVAQYDSFAIWDTTIGFKVSQDSLVIVSDTAGTGGTGVAHVFDGLYLRRCYEGYLTDDAILFTPMVVQNMSAGRRRPLLIKLGGN